MIFFKKTNFWISILGVFSIIAGAQIIITGKLKAIIFLGDEKYIVGGVFVFFGLYIVALLLLNKIRGNN